MGVEGWGRLNVIMITLCRFFLISMLAVGLRAGPSATEPLIRVNQIGYLPEANKVAVIADPQVGQNAAESFAPGAVYELRRWDDDVAVFSGAPQVWNGGATHGQSGDRGWWFDFSSVTEPGSYYVWDVDRSVGSYGFEIGSDIYNEVLVAAMRTFYYQRLGEAKEARHAGEAWADGASFVGPGQDGECRSVYAQQDASTERELSGGWMDAGDYNKYVTFAEGPVHQLLHAFRERPEVFSDSYGIPESGNGIPDILDEVRFEMLWLSKMQEADGGVLLKMGNIAGASASPPSADKRPRYYVPSCSSSTIAAAGMYAHAAFVFRDRAVWQDLSDTLAEQAILAWNWYHANPKSANCDEQIVQAGDADRSLGDQLQSAMVSAIYLHLLTGDEVYRQYVLDNFGTANPFSSGFYSVYTSFASDALLHYAATEVAPASVRETVRQRKLSQENGDAIMAWVDRNDLYRAYMPNAQYHWGSLIVSANFANANLDYQTFGFAGADLATRRKRAEGFLDYYFGVNPMGYVYLTRMEGAGAERSVQQIYHSWFAYDSIWDTNPPPGYVPGGPNSSYSGTIAALKGLPQQKSYLDFNESWPENSWEITENAIYYQAAFVKMLSKFVSVPQPVADVGDDDGDGIANSFEDWFGFEQGEFDGWDKRVRVGRSGDGFSLEVVRRKGAVPGLVGIEYSTDLAAWAALDWEDAMVVSVSDTLERGMLPVSVELGQAVFARFSLGGLSQVVPLE